MQSRAAMHTQTNTKDSIFGLKSGLAIQSARVQEQNATDIDKSNQQLQNLLHTQHSSKQELLQYSSIASCRFQTYKLNTELRQGRFIISHWNQCCHQ
jgi:hypothetical protein